MTWVLDKNIRAETADYNHDLEVNFIKNLPPMKCDNISIPHLVQVGENHHTL